MRFLAQACACSAAFAPHVSIGNGTMPDKSVPVRTRHRLVEGDGQARSSVALGDNVPLKLPLDHGYFAVLEDGGTVKTCYTDRTDTSRSSACTPAELLAFCRSVVRRFGPGEGGSTA